LAAHDPERPVGLGTSTADSRPLQSFSFRDPIHLHSTGDKERFVDISAENPTSNHARLILDRLSDTLASITGDSGRSSFSDDDVHDDRAVFVLARDGADIVGCGAIRCFDETTAELKRMYAPYGNGVVILRWLEARAEELGYDRIVLSTRVINTRAVQFYQKHGYNVIDNYGHYAGLSRSVCMSKSIR